MSTIADDVRTDRERERAMKKRYEDHFPGWRRSTSTHQCPRWVARKHCQAFRYWGRQCVCQHHGYVLDHVRLWINPKGERVLTAEPYNADGESMAAFVEDCAGLGLRVSLSGSSPYYPGSTFTVYVQRA